jgi:hypothetical protein
MSWACRHPALALVLAFINAPLFILLLSALLIGGGADYLTRRERCYGEANQLKAQVFRTNNELLSRMKPLSHEAFSEDSAAVISLIFSKFVDPPSHYLYLEFKDRNNDELIEEFEHSFDDKLDYGKTISPDQQKYPTYEPNWSDDFANFDPNIRSTFIKFFSNEWLPSAIQYMSDMHNGKIQMNSACDFTHMFSEIKSGIAVKIVILTPEFDAED